MIQCCYKFPLFPTGFLLNLWFWSKFWLTKLSMLVTEVGHRCVGGKFELKNRSPTLSRLQQVSSVITTIMSPTSCHQHDVTNTKVKVRTEIWPKFLCENQNPIWRWMQVVRVLHAYYCPIAINDVHRSKVKLLVHFYAGDFDLYVGFSNWISEFFDFWDSE